MAISNIGSGVSIASTRDFPVILAKTDKQKVITEKVTASLPGNNKREIHRTVADIVRVSQTFNKKLQFVVDQQSNEVIVKVIDKATDKVIKVLPPEELQRLHRKLKEAIGFLINEQV